MLSRLEAITAVTVIITDGVEDADIITVGDTIITDSNPKEAASVGGLFHFGYPLAPPALPTVLSAPQLTESTAMRGGSQRQDHPSGVKLGPGVGVIQFLRGKKNMREALLLNPFSSNPEPGKKRPTTRPTTRSTPVCSNCQSDDIVSHAVAQWSNESQEWQLASTFGQPAHCNDCNGPCGIVWLPR
jgi:hypothetical protein